MVCLSVCVVMICVWIRFTCGDQHFSFIVKEEGGREELEERNELEEARAKGGILNNQKMFKQGKFMWIFMWTYRTLNRISTPFLAWLWPCYLLVLANIRENLKLLAPWIRILGVVYVWLREQCQGTPNILWVLCCRISARILEVLLFHTHCKKSPQSPEHPNYPSLGPDLAWKSHEVGHNPFRCWRETS